MSYIGQQLPADVFSGYVTDTFTGDGSATTFTLSKAPFSADSLIVVVDNVIQQPTTNFTVSGTTLTIVGTAILSGIKGYAIHTGGPVAITQASKVDVNGLSDGVILDADADTTISADTDDQIDFKAGGTDIMSLTATTATFNDGVTITTADNTDTLTLISTDTDANYGPNIEMSRPVTGATNDLIGRIDFSGQDADGNTHNYFSMEAIIDDATSGGEEGRMLMRVEKDGSTINIFDINGSEVVINEDSKDYDFRVEADAFTHALFVDGGTGNVYINQTSNYSSGALQVTESTADTQPAWFQHDASSGNPYGIVMQFRNQAPDNNTVYLQSWQDSSAIRARCWADGDFQNHDGTYSTLSDERIKQNITAANSQWDDIKALQFKNFKKKDDVTQYGEDKAPVHLGLIAQEVESVSPNLVKEYAASELDKDLHSDFNDWENSTIKGIKYSILYMKAVKALQEAMAKIETLETKVQALEDA